MQKKKKLKNPLIEIAFEPIKQSLKRDLRKYEEIREKRREAGKASADKRQQVLTSVEHNEQVLTSATVNDNVNVNDNVIVSDREREFENFRSAYPGTKRGFETEFENFKKKHKDWTLILPNLLPSLKKQIEARAKIKTSGGFVPEWQHLQTYINQSSWEIIYNNNEEVNIPQFSSGPGR